MEIGMLWIDEGRGRDLASRVKEAAASYEAQYGVAPSICLLNPSQLNESEGELNGLRLEASPSLLPNYFWIGHRSEKWAKPTSLRESKTFSTDGSDS